MPASEVAIAVASEVAMANESHPRSKRKREEAHAYDACEETRPMSPKTCGHIRDELRRADEAERLGPQPAQTNALDDMINSCKSVTMDMNGHHMHMLVKDGATVGDALCQYAYYNRMENKRRRLSDPNAPVAFECPHQYRVLDECGQRVNRNVVAPNVVPIDLELVGGGPKGPEAAQRPPAAPAPTQKGGTSLEDLALVFSSDEDGEEEGDAGAVPAAAPAAAASAAPVDAARRRPRNSHRSDKRHRKDKRGRSGEEGWPDDRDRRRPRAAGPQGGAAGGAADASASTLKGRQVVQDEMVTFMNNLESTSQYGMFAARPSQPSTAIAQAEGQAGPSSTALVSHVAGQGSEQARICSQRAHAPHPRPSHSDAAFCHRFRSFSSPLRARFVAPLHPLHALVVITANRECFARDAGSPSPQAAVQAGP